MERQKTNEEIKLFLDKIIQENQILIKRYNECINGNNVYSRTPIK